MTNCVKKSQYVTRYSLVETPLGFSLRKVNNRSTKSFKESSICATQMKPATGVRKKKLKYAASLQENTHAKVWFQWSYYATLLKSHFGKGVLL